MKHALLGLGLAVFCVGCSSNKLPSYDAPLVLSPGAAVELGWDNKQIPVDEAIVRMASLSSTDQQKSVMVALLTNSDDLCERYMQDVLVTSNGVISGLGVTNLALTTAAGVTTPARSANILSNLATFATGTEELLSDTVLGGNSPNLIYKSVVALRKKERARLYKLLQDSSAGPFSVAAELHSYHSKCGPIVGLNGLEAAVETADSEAGARGAAEATVEIQELTQ